MPDQTFRFGRKRRWPFGSISRAQFVLHAAELVFMIFRERLPFELEVLTCEDERTYEYSNVTFFDYEVTEALKNRHSYELEDVDKDVWGRALKIEFRIRSRKNNLLMLSLICDRFADPRRLRFYGQGLPEKAQKKIVQQLGTPTFTYAIDSGSSVPSEFNSRFGKGLTGMFS